VKCGRQEKQYVPYVLKIKNKPVSNYKNPESVAFRVFLSK